MKARMRPTTTFGLLAAALFGFATAAHAAPPTPQACRDGDAEAAACEAAYDPGFRVLCFQESELVFEGEVWLVRGREADPLPYVQMDGSPVAPLWERYGACKIKRADDGGAA